MHWLTVCYSNKPIWQRKSTHVSPALRASVRTCPLTTQSHPVTPNYSAPHITLCICVYGGGWGKWQTVIFGSVAQPSCISDFWQCLDSILRAKGSGICQWDGTQLSCCWKAFHANGGALFGGVFLVENKLGWWSIITHSAEFFVPVPVLSPLQLLQYLPLSNVNAPKIAQLFICIILCPILHHFRSRPLFTIHRGEKYQQLVCLSKLF